MGLNVPKMTPCVTTKKKPFIIMSLEELRVEKKMLKKFIRNLLYGTQHGTILQDCRRDLESISKIINANYPEENVWKNV